MYKVKSALVSYLRLYLNIIKLKIITGNFSKLCFTDLQFLD